MIRPGLRVARPLGWSGRMARVSTVVLAILLLIPVALARLPEGVVAWAGGYELPVRLAGALFVLWVTAWIRALVYSRLPEAPWAYRGHLALRERGRKRRVPLTDLRDVYVELRPPPVYQVFVVELADGTVRELCPLDWPGAGRLYQYLRRHLERRARSDLRAERRSKARRGRGRSSASMQPDAHPRRDDDQARRRE